MVVTMGQQYNVGEKPTVILYTYRNHHAQPPIMKPVKCRGENTSILYNIINCHARMSHRHRIHGKIGLQLSLLHYIRSDGCY